MRPLPLCALLLLSSGLLRAQPAAPSLQSLISNSPFGTAATSGPNAGMPTGPLEFRGTFVDNGERFFSLLDPATRRSEWVGLNEAGRPFTVKNYDAERETIVVEYQGRSLDLKLHAARISVLPPVAAAPTTMPAGANAPRPEVMPAPSTTEAQRLAQVAEEIRRRRALRQQAQQAAASGQVTPGNPFPPNNAPPPNTPPPRN